MIVIKKATTDCNQKVDKRARTCYILGVTKRFTVVVGGKTMINARLREEIKRKYTSESKMAAVMGWSRQKLSKTILGERNPKIADINVMSKALGISVGEVISFFTQ